MKKIITILLVLLLATACHSKPKLERFSQTSLTAGFDTAISLIAYTEDQKSFDRYFALMVESFQRYNKLFDIYNNYDGMTNLKSVNDHAGQGPLSVDQDIIDLLTTVQKDTKTTQGLFNITLGPVLQIWHDFREKGIVANQSNFVIDIPQKEILKQANECTSMDLLKVDPDKKTVELTKSCARLDVGGIAKGFASQKVKEILEEAGLTSAIINAGGNVVTIGSKPDGAAWSVGIIEPAYIPKDSIAVFDVTGSNSMVTSGDYQRYFIALDGKMYHHIIDPTTLYPARHFRSVTIQHPDSGLADLMSTVLFVMDYETGKAWVNQYNKDNPNSKMEVMWLVDETNDSYDHPDFKPIGDKAFKASITSGLESSLHK